MPVIILGLILLIIWRVVAANPNRLVNADFELGDTTGWNIAGAGSPEAIASMLTVDNNIMLVLNIPKTPTGSWAGIGQRLNLEPEQPYRVSVDYRLVGAEQSAATLVVRLSQLDVAGKLITSQEFSPPTPLSPQWNTFTHYFITNPETTAIELGIALFGNNAASLEVDRLALTYPNRLDALKRDPAFIWSVLLLAIISIGYAIFRRTQPQTVMVKLFKPRLVAIIAVNIIIFFICAELFALAIYFFRDGALFYTNKKIYQLVRQQNEKESPTPYRFHPYFGYIRAVREAESIWEDIDPKLRTINNHGLFSDYDYPVLKTAANQYIIGVFGGSVAEQFALLGRDEFIKKLKQDAFFADKEIIVLNFARGGYKQPQQLLVLAYFLSLGQPFDMVINLDGFNEVTLGHRNNSFGVDFTMPTRGVYNALENVTNQDTLTPKKLESLAQLNRYQTRLNQVAESINHNRVASLNFVLEQYYAIIQQGYDRELARFDELASKQVRDSVIFVKRQNQPLPEASLMKAIAEHWANSSVAMRDLLAARRIPYYHFLQPNQYYSNKVFTPEELATTLDNEHPYHPAAKVGYPALIEVFPTLKEQGVNFYNGIPLFDKVSETIYRDTCCHYNELGNALLAKFMADVILTSADFKASINNAAAGD